MIKWRMVVIGTYLTILVCLLLGCQTLEPNANPPVASKVTIPSVSTPVVQLRWFGQSTFLLTSSQGTGILMDPTNASGGYVIDPIDGVDAVLTTHEHSDHNNSNLAKGTPIIIKGLNSSGWNSIDQTVKDTHILSISPNVPVYHDNQQGAQRGRNTIFVIEVDGLRLVHVGDLGHVLTPEMIQAIGKVDVLLLPVGGNFTIDAVAATQVANQLAPKEIIPMHFKTSKMQAGWQGAGVEAFLEGKTVERPNSNILRLSKDKLPSQTTVVVMNYE